jgi:TPR repeat protein
MPVRQPVRSKAEMIWIRADKEWESGNPREAFRLMLVAAKMGESGAQVNVGYMYEHGVGRKRNRQAALYWYKRACRRGESCAAHNIGTVWRDVGSPRRALHWFERAIKMSGGDDGEANLEIAKLYLQKEPRKATLFLKKACKSKFVTQDAVEEARRLLKRTSLLLG